ncbi:MAG: hypothetical protein P0Y55_08275 [Candidatus Cohnella colombiensis]|uniref:Uncharacterized protein n=1 Tax=Candidatus Cohnella colombiensis TaxID=3121368 RepID=A0AA95JD78_9BACL|nr:MAG: hypothetical protein P0Y55_08275 [Cohnella sp.]
MKSVAIMIIFLCLIGCGNENNPIPNTAENDVNEQVESTKGSLNDPISDLITVTGPMTISSNDMYPIIQKNYLLNLQLVKGRYYEDWSPSPYKGRGWTGEFQLVISDDYGNVKSIFQISDYFTEDLIFNALFEIEFDDYNGDANIDFTIGQYGSSNGNFYKIFTITDDDQIKELPVKGIPELFISGGTNRYSTKLDKLDDVSFKKTAYDNSIGKDIEATFIWEGNEFVRTE